MVTGNRRDREMDIVLVSSRDGSVIRNLTSEFDQDKGWEFIIQPGMRFNTVPWLSWARLATASRTSCRKNGALILQNVITTEIEQRLEMREVDDLNRPTFHRTDQGRVRRIAGWGRRHLGDRSPDAATDQRHKGQFRGFRSRGRPTDSRSSMSRASAAMKSCSVSTSRRARRPS